MASFTPELWTISGKSAQDIVTKEILICSKHQEIVLFTLQVNNPGEKSIVQAATLQGWTAGRILAIVNILYFQMIHLNLQQKFSSILTAM